MADQDIKYLKIALEEAKKSAATGGVPIGAVLVAANGTILGQGYNQRVQKQSAILHAETSALENAGRLPATAYKGATMYTTLSPCDMCTGACLLYGIPRVVIGENRTFVGGEAQLKNREVELVNIDDSECYEVMQKFIRESPQIWNEDIGVE